MKNPHRHLEATVSTQFQEPILASVAIKSKGSVRAAIWGGALGMLIASMVSSSRAGNAAAYAKGQIPVPANGYLCVTPTRLAIFEVKMGLGRSKLGELILMTPRQNVAALTGNSKHLAWLPAELRLMDGRQMEFVYHRGWREDFGKVQAFFPH